VMVYHDDVVDKVRYLFRRYCKRLGIRPQL
jgi:hypothetical protein